MSCPHRAAICRPTSRRTRERDRRDARCFDQRRARLRAESRDKVDDAGRDSGLDKEFDKGDGEGRGVLRRFQHDRIAGEQRRKHLPTWDRDREVPGGDQAHDADGYPLGHAVHFGALGGDDAAAGHSAERRDVVGHVDGFLDIPTGLDEDFAHLIDHQAGEPFLFALQQLTHPKQRRTAYRSGRPPPLGISGACCCHRRIDIRFLGACEEADHLGGPGRIYGCEGMTVLRAVPRHRR